jgi:hypothetical protein
MPENAVLRPKIGLIFNDNVYNPTSYLGPIPELTFSWHTPGETKENKPPCKLLTH